MKMTAVYSLGVREFCHYPRGDQLHTGREPDLALMSLLVAPIFRDKLNHQFMLGARNQSFLTEYVSGMATVKSLQMEPDIDRKYGDLLSQYLAAGFGTKQIGNTYNVIANGIEQVMTLSILIVGALLVMDSSNSGTGFTVGMRIYVN